MESLGIEPRVSSIPSNSLISPTTSLECWLHLIHLLARPRNHIYRQTLLDFPPCVLEQYELIAAGQKG